jgi:hypothetical protein
MNLKDFKSKLKKTPAIIEFSETIGTIETNYNFIPTAFTNGDLKNESGQNSGSCKLFAFAVAQNLTKGETLACFGQYYFDEVLSDSNGSGHQNIRNFMKTGFEGLVFEGVALVKK